MDSTESKIKILKNQLSELATVTLDTDVFKGLVVGATNFLEVLTKILDKLPLLSTLIGGAVGLRASSSKVGLGLFNTDKNVKGILNPSFFAKTSTKATAFTPSDAQINALNAIKRNFNLSTMDNTANNRSLIVDEIKNYTEAGDALQGYAEKVENLSDVTQEKFVASMNTSGTAVATFSSKLESAGSKVLGFGKMFLGTIGNMAVAMAASWVIGKVIEGINYLLHYSENIIKAGKEAKESIDGTFQSFSEGKQSIMDLGSSFADQSDQIKTTGDAIDQIAEKYSELRKGVSNDGQNENVSLSTDEYQKYIDLSNQLASQFPGLVSGYDSQGNAILNLGTNADKAAASIRNLYEAQVASANVDMGKNLQDTYNGIAEQTSEYAQDIADKRTQLGQLDADISANKRSILKYGDNNFEVQGLYSDKENVITDVLKENGLYKENTGDDGNIWNFYAEGLADKSKEEVSEMNQQIIDGMAAYNETLETQRSQLISEIDAYDLMIEDQWRSMSQAFGDYLQTSRAFNDLDDNLQNAFLANISNLNLNALNDPEKYNGNVKKFLYEEFLEPMSKFDSTVQENISNALQIDSSKLTIQEYKDQVDKEFNKAFPKKKDKDKIAVFENAYGFDSSIEEMEDNASRLKEAYKDISGSSDFIDSMQTGDLAIAIQLINDGTLDAEKGLDNLSDSIKEFKKNQNAKAKSDTTLSSILSDSDSAISSSIDTLQTNLSSLSDTLQSLKTGDFKESDLTDLIQQFPQLAGETDNLQEAISNLQAENITSVISDINDAMEGASSEEIAKANALKQSILASVDLSGINAEKIYSQIVKSYSDDNSMEGMGSKAADEIISAFGDELQTGLGKDTLYKLLLDEDNAKLPVEELRKKYNEALPDAKEYIQQNAGFQSAVTKYQEDYAALLAAQEDLKNGTFDASVYNSLFEKFPELATASMDELPGLVQSKMQEVTSTVQNVLSDSIATYRLAGKNDQADILQAYFDSIQESVEGLDFSSVSEKADNFISNVSSLNTAFSSLKDGTFTDNDLAELAGQFTQLGDATDDLGTAISNLAVDQFSQAMQEINNAIDNETDPTKVKQLENKKNILIKTTSLPDVSLDTLSDQVTNTFGDNASAFEKEFSKEVNNQFARNILSKIVADESVKDKSFAEIRQSLYDNLPSYENLIKQDDSDFQKAISSYQSDIQALQDAKKDLEDKTFDPSTYTSLFEEFPELATAPLDELPGLIQSKLNDVNAETENAINSIADLYRQSGNEDAANGIVAYFKYIQESVDDLNLSNISTNVSNAQSDIEKLNTAFNSLKEGTYTDSDIAGLKDEFSDLIGITDDFDKAVSQLAVKKFTKSMNDINDAIASETDSTKKKLLEQKKNLLMESTELPDIDVDTFKKQLISQLAEQNVGTKDIEKYVNYFFDTFSSQIENGYSRNILSKVIADSSVLTQGFSAIQESYLSNIDSVKDIIQDESLQTQLTDYQDKYQALYQAQKDVKNGLMTGSTRKTFLDKFPDLAKYAGNTEDLSSAIDDLMDSMDSDVTTQFADAIQALRDAGEDADASALQAYVDDVVNGAHDIEGAYQKIAGLKIPTPQYAELKEALESSNEGDLYNELLSQYKTAKEAWEKGEVGTDDFKTFASIISPTGVSDAVNFGENKAMFERYFQDSSTGVENFLEDLQKLNLASNESGHWTSTLGNNLDEMKDAAQQLNMGFEPFMMMFGRLEDYGATTDFFTTEEEGQQHLSDLYEQIAEKKQKLAEIKADPELSGDQSAINALNQDLEELYARVQNTQTGLEEYPEKAAYYEKKNLEQAKDVVAQMNADIQEATEQGNKELAKTIEKARDNYLKENGYVLQAEVQGPQKQGTIESPLAREFTNPKEFGNYESVIQKIQNATEEQKSSLQESIATLSQYSENELGNIDLFDGQYTPGLESAEQALDSLVSTFGLTKEEALQLVAVLSDMGQIKATPEVELTTLNDQLKETDKSLKDIQKETGIEIDMEFSLESMTPDEMDKKAKELKDAAEQLEKKGYSDQASQVSQTADNLQEYSRTVRIKEIVEKDGDVEDLQNLIKQGDTETIQKKYGITVEGEDQLKELNEQIEQAQANKDAQIDMTVKLDESQLNKLLGGQNNEQVSINLTANNDEVKAKIDESKNYAEKSKGTIKIDGNSYSAISKATDAVNSINNMTGTIKVDADIRNMADAINNELNKAHTINISANVTAHVSGSASGGAPKGASTFATGTALRIAHADGTAYNVLNYTPAHADGNISLNNNETALVNELGIYNAAI